MTDDKTELVAEAAPADPVAAPPEAAPHGLILHRFDNGRVCCEMPYEHGVLQGQGKMYYTTGGLYALETYARDVLNGPTKLYYPSGVLQAELQYLDGLLDGTIKEYFPSGRAESVREYVRGKKNGPGVVYDETGLDVTHEFYVDDELTSTKPPAPTNP